MIKTATSEAAACCIISKSPTFNVGTMLSLATTKNGLNVPVVYLIVKSIKIATATMIAIMIR
jgi:hypothetical protein